jgi:hypothetical protein
VPTPSTIVNPKCLIRTNGSMALISFDRVYCLAGDSLSSISYSVNFNNFHMDSENIVSGRELAGGSASFHVPSIGYGDRLCWSIKVETADGSSTKASGFSVCTSNGSADTQVYLASKASSCYGVILADSLSESDNVIETVDIDD